MKKIISLALALLMIVSALGMFASCNKDDNTITVYTEAGFAPYEFIYNNEVVGVDIEIMKAVAAKLGKELIITDVAFDTICTSVQNGKADAGAAGITITDERAESVDFSIPYSSTEQYVIVKADNTAIATVEDLANKKIGVQSGTTSDLLVDGLIKGGSLGTATLTPYTTPAQAAAGIPDKVDAVVTDKLTAMLIVANDPSLKAFALVKADGTPAAEVEKYGIAVQKGNQELLDAINEVLTELIANGTIDQWIVEYSAKAQEVGA